MNKYTMVAESSTGAVIKEQEVPADCYMDARRVFWRGLTDEQRNACANVDCVDECESQPSA